MSRWSTLESAEIAISGTRLDDPSRDSHDVHRSRVGTRCAWHPGVAPQSFKDLRVWREAMQLALDVYKTCARFPHDERFLLAAQLKRAAVSIPSNIAEGARRRRVLPFVFHLEVALGSQAEVEVQLELANELGFVPDGDFERLRERADKVGRMLNRLLDRLRPPTTNDKRPTTN